MVSVTNYVATQYSAPQRSLVAASGSTSPASASDSGATAVSTQDQDSATKQLQRLSDSLDFLKNSLQSDSEQRKTIAQEKLERAKQELAMLKQWGFPPEVIARRAAQLGLTVAGAAQEFVAASASGLTPGYTATDGVAGASFAAPSEANSRNAGETGDAEDGNTVAIPEAYRETLEIGREDRRLSQEDQRTLADFKAVLQEIKALLEKALREIRAEEAAIHSNDGALGEIEDTVSALDRTAGTLGAEPVVFGGLSI